MCKNRLAIRATCYYSAYMKSVVLKVSRIGNSRGIRLPAAMLRKYHITDTVIAEEKADEIVLRPGRAGRQKLSWGGNRRRHGCGERGLVRLGYSRG